MDCEGSSRPTDTRNCYVLTYLCLLCHAVLLEPPFEVPETVACAAVVVAAVLAVAVARTVALDDVSTVAEGSWRLHTSRRKLSSLALL